MSILLQLSSALGHRTDAADIELATRIAENNDATAVAELVTGLADKRMPIKSDCLKTLYETGYRNPALIARHVDSFVALLSHKNNRLVWGAMIALDTITALRPKEVHAVLTTILSVADAGSVITNDHCVGILVGLAKLDAYRAEAFPLLLQRLRKSPVNQTPKYIEQAATAVDLAHMAAFLEVVEARRPDINSAPGLKRIDKAVAKVQKLK